MVTPTFTPGQQPFEQSLNTKPLIVWLLRFLSITYLVLGLFFFFKSEAIFYLINIGPKVFGVGLELPASTEKFWLVLSTSMMMMLFLTALAGSMNPHQRSIFLIHLISKVTSIVAFFYLFLNETKYFAYLFGGIVDSAVLLILILFYLKSVISKPISVQMGKVTPREPTL